MDSQRANAIVFGVLMVLGLGSAAMAMSVWSQRDTVAGFRPLVTTMLAAAQVLIAYGMSFAAVSVAIQAWALDFSYLGWLILPPASVAYVLQATQRDRWLTTAVQTVLIAIAVGFAVLIWGPAPHSVFFGPGRDPVTLVFPATPAYLLFYGYSMALMAIAGAVMIAELRRPRVMNHRQATLVLIAMAVPMVFSVASAADISWANMYPNIPALFITVALTFSVARYRSMDVRQLAADDEESTSEGIVIFGTDRRISQLNSAAVRLLGPGRSPAMGLRIEEVWSESPIVLSALRGGPVNLVSIDDGDGGTRHLLFTRTEIADGQDQAVGWLVRVREADRMNQKTAR